ncbi:Trehalose/maltose hydrolase-like predicted phosphorylase OS=Streptomyces albaduncus OX=68172 GN=FHS32_002752 PE=3 SV=1 [Streptomyces griseoloalbus]
MLGVEQVRLVHMADPHLAALRTVVTAEEWSGELEVECVLDGDVTNSNVHRYRSLSRHHLVRVRTGTSTADVTWLSCRTSTSDIGIGMAARTATGQPPTASELRPSHHRAVHRLVIPVAPGWPAVVRQDGGPAHLPGPGDQRPARRGARPGGHGP